nr:PREDICTED: uncharacterized protein K02A2.6-like [Latimeria chalumnae]|eukprot:XP_014350933.1 PREDICTED: uncharacterized protein K02A2.6-like [Latimeria chalumnae]
MLAKLHERYQGIIKCRARVQQSVWWPGLSVHIQQIVESCETCQKHSTPQKKPLRPTPVSQRPWQRIRIDLFLWEQSTYLLIVDYFSRYIEVAKMSIMSADVVIQTLKNIFRRHGILQFVVSDDGPQFAAASFKEFAKDFGFTHNSSSPRYPQAKGEAEHAIATLKRLWKKASDKSKALIAYRATPLEHGFFSSTIVSGETTAYSTSTVTCQFDPKVAKP